MTEISDRYDSLSATFAERLALVPADAWSNVAPCEGWTTRDVAKHVIDGHAAFLPGGGLSPLADDGDPVAAFATARAAMMAALEDPARASATVESPMGPMPLEMLVGRIFCTDVLVHTWDLSRAAGIEETIDADACKHAYEGLKPMDAMIRRPGVFGPAVETPEGADAQTTLLTFLGRQV